MKKVAPKKPVVEAFDISGLLGEDQSLFPKEVTTVDGQPGKDEKVTQQATSQPATEPALPAYAQGTIEPMLNPTVCLVAPDVTPDAVTPIDPADVPHPPVVAPPPAPTTEPGQPTKVGGTEDSKKDVSVLQTILGRRPQGPEAPSVESVHIPGITDVVVENVDGSAGSPTGYNVMAAAMSPGLPMPDPVQDPAATARLLQNVRRFIR